MSTTTTTTKRTTKAKAEAVPTITTPALPAPAAAFWQQVEADAAQVITADMDALRTMFATQAERETQAARMVGIAAVATWQTRGEIILRAALLLRGLTADKVTQAIGLEIATDVNGLGVAVDNVSKAQVGRYLEAAKWNVRAALRDADDAMDQAHGPKSRKAVDVLVWTKVKRGYEPKANIAGQVATVTLAEANVAKAEATQATQAKAEAAKAAQVADQAKVKAAKSDKRFGLVTKRQLAEAKAAQDVDSLRDTIRYCEAVLAEIAEAKAKAAAAEAARAKAAKAAEAEADDMVAAAHDDAEAMRSRIAELEAALAAK